MDFKIEKMRPGDWEKICIGCQADRSGYDLVSDADLPRPEDLSSKYITQHNYIARRGDNILGWAAIAPVTEGGAFTGTASVNIYVDPKCRKMGVGSALLKCLVDQSARSGIQTLQVRVVPKNIAGLLLHKEFGFKATGLQRSAGRIGNNLQDMVLLERQAGA